MRKENEFFQDTDDDCSVITMKDTETGENIEFVVIDSVDIKENSYLLVTESQNIYEENAEALILKEITLKDTDEVNYIIVEDDKEIDKVINLLNEASDDYDIQI